MSSRLAICVGVAGLSAMGIFGTFKFVKVWRRVERARLREQATLRRQEEELDLLRRSLSESQAEVEEKKMAAQAHVEEIERLGRRMSDTERELEDMRRQNRVLAERTKQLSTRGQQLEGELQHTKLERQQATELLEVRTAELKGAQAFLTKADQLSGADVIKLVEVLNADIMQISASMAEDLTIEEKRFDSNGKELESDETREAFARTEEIVGARMAELLKSSEHHEDPILIQLAFQAGMTAYTHWIISSWCFENPDDEHMLSEIYARVREAEEQAVSGRWRQLTRTHLQRMLAHEPEQLAVDMVDVFSNIIVTAGLKESPATVHERIMTSFGDRIRMAMKHAQNMNKKIGEGITSCDLEVLYIVPEIPFNPNMMEDAIGSTSITNNHESVVCTTDLGLARTEKLSGTIGQWNEAVLLKPKVVLPSGLVGIAGGSA
ncbi:unnamed protein product [Cyclocybe aegerita]|uniref:Uncharacterized protein n=1 Tax=Cyclocybe aegerita TaxID=1973307 RepID=A0A8S0VQK9_CYCAE|nr:unnamed protein product [Cyclocybe aegerita]